MLLFSQFKLVLDVLEPVLDLLGFKGKHVRLDGTTPVAERCAAPGAAAAAGRG